MKLTEKQLAKVKAITDTVFETDDVAEAGKVLSTDQSFKAIVSARKALKAEIKKLDKALVVYEIDLAFDEAKALVEKKGA